jgi:hypothetical protein
LAGRLAIALLETSAAEQTQDSGLKILIDVHPRHRQGLVERRVGRIETAFFQFRFPEVREIQGAGERAADDVGLLHGKPSSFDGFVRAALVKLAVTNDRQSHCAPCGKPVSVCELEGLL